MKLIVAITVLVIPFIHLNKSQIVYNINNTVNYNHNSVVFSNNTINYNAVEPSTNFTKWVGKILREAKNATYKLVNDEISKKNFHQNTTLNDSPSIEMNESLIDDPIKSNLAKNIQMTEHTKEDNETPGKFLPQLSSNRSQEKSYNAIIHKNNIYPKKRELEKHSLINKTKDIDAIDLKSYPQKETQVRFIQSEMQRGINIEELNDIRNSIAVKIENCIRLPFSEEIKSKIINKCLIIYKSLSERGSAFTGNLIYTDTIILMILKGVLDSSFISHNFNDSCMIDSLSSLNAKIIRGIEIEVNLDKFNLNIWDYQNGKNSSIRRKTRGILEADDDYIQSISRKSASKAINALKDTGLLLSKPLRIDLDLINTSSTQITTVNKLNFSESNSIRILRFPRLDWSEPLYEINLDNLNEGLEGDFIHLIRSEEFLSKMPKCKDFPIWKYRGYSLKCINKVSIINMIDAGLCRIAVDCKGRINNNFTCIEEKLSAKCPHTTLLTNHDSYGFYHSELGREKSISSDSFNYENINFPKSSGDFKLCSIDNFWYSHNTCNGSLSYFGEVQFYLTNSGPIRVSVMAVNKFQLNFNSSDINYYTCTDSECLFENTMNHCTGDRLFCSRVNKMCNVASSKKCHLINNGMGFKTLDSSQERVSSYITLWTIIRYEAILIDDEETFLMPINEHESLYFQKLCKYSLSCSNAKIHVESNCVVNKIVINMGDNFIWYNYEEEDSMFSADLTLPFNILKGNMQPIITVYGLKGIITREIVSCEPFDLCLRVDCFLCTKKLINPSCMNQDERIILILIIIILFILITTIFILGFRFTKEKIPIVKSKLHNLRKFNRKFPSFSLKTKKEKEENEEDDSENEKDKGDSLNSVLVRDNRINSSLEHVPRQFIRKSVYSYRFYVPSHYYDSNSRKSHLIIVYLLSIMLGLGTSRACSDSTILVSDQKECFSDGFNNAVCKVSSTLRISGPPVGQTTCVNIMDGDNNINGYISIKVLSNNYYCSKSSLYKTVQAKINPKSYSYCPGASSCPSWRSCTSFLNSSEKQHEMFPNTINKLSLFDCFTPGGCAGNGCMRCDNGCSFHSIELVNSDDIIYEVFECPTWIPHLSVEVKFHNLPGMNDFETTLIGAEPYSEDGLKLAKIADSTPINNNDFCLIRDDKAIYYSSCQKSTELFSGSIGEIRCPTNEDALGLTDKCLIAKNTVKVKSINWDAIITNNQINIKKAIQNQRLPKLHGTAMIDRFSDGTVIMKNTIAETYEIQFSIKNLEISIRKEKSTCSGEDLSIEGCYSCMGGATMKIKLSANRDDTLAVVSCTGLNPIPISINKTMTLYTQGVYLQTSIAGLDCTVKCSGGTLKIPALINLKEQVMLDVSNEDKAFVVTKPINLWSVLDTNKMWLMIPTLSLGSVIIIVTIVIFAYKNTIGKVVPNTIIPMYTLSKRD
ncbi:putative glycoprotein [Hubei lepidoptera virus 1]|uniref:Putative glycoprotein n=1 Tax=Hubei lepidoptera virus 1 TaxID=1922903 RepID=A0A1L3KPF5_9VIRU|nr:putative glycoprotein [Hubei lepidoptera virus 1]APG79262.1 putative glycoprotein [Hubei lepidoptera virus 1]